VAMAVGLSRGGYSTVALGVWMYCGVLVLGGNQDKAVRPRSDGLGFCGRNVGEVEGYIWWRCLGFVSRSFEWIVGVRVLGFCVGHVFVCFLCLGWVWGMVF